MSVHPVCYIDIVKQRLLKGVTGPSSASLRPNPLVFWRFIHAWSMANFLAKRLWRSSITSQTAASSGIWNLCAVSSQITLLLRTSYLITGPADTGS